MAGAATFESRGFATHRGRVSLISLAILSLIHKAHAYLPLIGCALPPSPRQEMREREHVFACRHLHKPRSAPHMDIYVTDSLSRHISHTAISVS